MNSIVGITFDKTLKIKGQIEGVGVIVLVDSRASHNFILHDLVRKLGMQIETGKKFGVMVGNGVTVKGEGVCRAVPLEVQGVRITQDFFPFELGGADVVLGVTWLSSLGDICANWKNLTMKFEWEGRRVSLQGDPSLVKIVISLKVMLRSLQSTGGGYLVEFCSMEGVPEQDGEPTDPRIVSLMEGYNQLFDQPTKLPPH